MFQAPNGIFMKTVSVLDEQFAQISVGQCFDIMYLINDPSVNDSAANVVAFEASDYWSDTHLLLHSFCLVYLY